MTPPYPPPATIPPTERPEPSRSLAWIAQELSEEERQELPAVYHRPHFDGLGRPHSWICTACWGEGYTTAWPCEAAVAGGVELAESLGVGWDW